MKKSKLFNKKIFHGILILGIFVFIIIILNKIVREGFYQTVPLLPNAGAPPVGVKPFTGTIQSGPPSTASPLPGPVLPNAGAPPVGVPTFTGTIQSGPLSTASPLSGPVIPKAGAPTSWS